LKRQASSGTLSPVTDDDEIEEELEETPTKGKGKKRAKQ
jgi:hypothetical protein